MMKANLLNKIERCQITVGIVGLDRAGLSLAAETAGAGFPTIAFDVQKAKVDMVNGGKGSIDHAGDDELKAMAEKGMLSAAPDFSFIKNVDFVVICLPALLDVHQQSHLGDIKSFAEEIVTYIRKETVIVLSTILYPGATERLLKPIFESSGMKCGTDFYLGFSSMGLDLSESQFRNRKTPGLVGAIGDDAGEVIAAMYSAVLKKDVCQVSSPAIAEMEMALEYTYLTISRNLVGETAALCNRIEIDYREVADAARARAYEFGATSKSADGEIDIPPFLTDDFMLYKDRLSEYWVESAVNILNCDEKALNGSKLLVLGITDKPDFDDDGKSLAISVIERLQAKGAEVEFYDSRISQCLCSGKPFRGLSRIDETIIAEYDLVLFMAGDVDLDDEIIRKHAQAFLDARNTMQM